MSSIIGISGSQGQGKSTLINELVKGNELVKALDIQTARTVLKEWGYTLAEVNSFMPLKVRFQEELFNRHCSELQQARYGELEGVYLVERTFADIFSYALTSLGPFNDYSEWLNDYADKCEEAQKQLFDHVVFLSGREYVPEEDGVRSTNLHFSRLTDHLIQNYTILFGWDGKENDAVSFLNVADLQKRVDFLNDLCKRIDNQNYKG